MNNLKPFLIGTAIGILYSSLYPLMGPRYTHFLPLITVSFSLLVGIITGFLMISAKKLFRSIHYSIPATIIGLLLSIHATYWILKYSNWIKLNTDAISWLCIITFVLTFILLTILLLMEQFLPSSLQLNFFMASIVIVLLITKFLLVHFIPLSVIEPYIVIEPPSQTRTSRSAVSYLYPLSISLEESIDRYPWLIPNPKSGRKIFVIILDAFREDYFGKKMSGINVTPNMQKFAQKNFYFPEYRVQAPWTKPSTASLFTGKYVREHATFLGDDKEALRTLYPNRPKISIFYGHKLPRRYETLAERLQNENYRNGAFISIAHINKLFQFDQGFKTYVHIPGQKLFNDLKITRSMFFWLLRNSSKRSFVYLHLEGPHYPYKEAKKYNYSFWAKTPYYNSFGVNVKKWRLDKIPQLLSKNNTKELSRYTYEKKFLRHYYSADLNYYDKYVFPTIKNTLVNMNLLSESLLVISSDHGESLFDHDTYGHGDKLFEESINVPLIMKMPKKFKHEKLQKKSDELKLETIDLTATLLDFAGADRSNISGESFLPWVRNGTGAKNFNYAISENPGFKKIHSTSIVQGKWKYIHDYRRNEGALYNLAKDPSERNPLIKRNSRSKRLFDQIVKTLGFKNKLTRTTKNALIKIPQKHAEDLKGLGYF